MSGDKKDIRLTANRAAAMHAAIFCYDFIMHELH